MVKSGMRGHKVMHCKLIRAFVLTNNISLPNEKISYHLLVVTVPFQLIGWIRGIVAGWKFIPIIQGHSPIIKSPEFIKRISCFVFLFHVINKTPEKIIIGSTMSSGFIIYLISDNGWMICIMLHHF